MSQKQENQTFNQCIHILENVLLLSQLHCFVLAGHMILRKKPLDNVFLKFSFHLDITK